MTKNPLVSLIIVNYNGHSITKAMTESILKNTNYSPYEIILVDNASTDQSQLMLKEYLKDIDNALLVSREVNDFLTGGYNAGFNCSNGQVLVFMNNDLVVCKKWLTPLVKALQQPDTGIAGSAMLSFDKKNIIDNLGCRRNWLGFGFRLDTGKKFNKSDSLKKVDFVPGSLIAIKRTLFQRLGKFDVDYLGNYEDVDLAWRAKKAGFKSVVALNSVVKHRGSWTVNKEQQKSYSSYLCRRNRLMTQIKNAPMFSLFIKLPIYISSQVILIIKEILINIRFDLAKASINAIKWNISNLSKNIKKRNQ